jgi:hypothetical protein
MARKSALSALSVRELQTELTRRQRRVGGMVRKHQRLLDKAARLAEQIRELGGSVNGSIGGGGRRRRNEMNLADALAKALHGKTMGVAEAAEAVQRAGYRTTSKTFRTIVNITLIKSGKFKRVERGQYTAKG